jgi:superfamily II DNA or RNA helicase
MPVKLINDSYFEVSDGQKVFQPGALEIYSVIFEGVRELRGNPVLAEDFTGCGVEFSNDTATPVIVLEADPKSTVPQVLCRLIARMQAAEAEVAHAGEVMLDYSIIKRVWTPLPLDTIDDARKFLGTVGLRDFGPITLSQYMKLLRLERPAFIIDDRTQNAFQASSIAPRLAGDPPRSLIGTLYPYQLDGYRWLSFMNEGGLGCIIGDEMGLGKTVQVICLILEAIEKNLRPNLVVAPATLLENWRRELARFAPNVNVLIHGGSRRTGHPKHLQSNDVVISSFDTAVADISLFKSIPWNLLILDEAQGIKNPAAKRSIQLKTIPRKLAVAVTGTPVENRLKDLWSITDFVIPSFLGTLPSFERNHPDTVDGASNLEPIVSPIILRRLVSEVAKDLPERIDIPQPLEMDTDSADAYEQIRADAFAQYGDAASLISLQKLRQFCTHPWLTDNFKQLDAAECSPKFSRLLEILDEIFSSGGKALIFTSFQESIDILVAQIAARTGTYADFIDGRVPVPDRQKKVDVFSAQPTAAILALKAREILGFFPQLDAEVKNPRVPIDVIDDTGREWTFAFIYYNNRRFGGTRNEFRLTGMTAFFREFNLKPGDIHLNSEYVRAGALDLNGLFEIEDMTEEVQAMLPATEAEMKTALEYVSQEAEPSGHCDCIYRGRSRHCGTFHHSNPDVPEYGVHDIARIGSGKAKLAGLVDRGIFRLEDLPAGFDLTDIQRNQVNAYIQDRVLIRHAEIARELRKLVFPVYFLDYETCPAAIPRFDGFSPYQQIPFQYSLHVLDRVDGEPRHEEFLSTTPGDPSVAMCASLQRHIGETGNVVVWSKKFERTINRELGERIPAAKPFLDSLNSRVFDLMDSFSKQLYVHKGFKGGTSIKDVLPVLVPELSYKDLAIQEGGTASQSWDKITSAQTSQREKNQIVHDLKLYCERDTFAMVAIWRHLVNLTRV